MSRIPVIVNPHSKRNKKRPGKSVSILNKIGGDSVDVIATSTIDELDALAGKCVNSDISCVCISGGDGTIHQVITRFIAVFGSTPLPAFVILKDGTINNISHTVELRGSGYSILRRLLRSMESGKALSLHRRTTMKIGDRYCFLFGTGFTTNLLSAIYEGGNKDTMKVLRVAARAFREGIFSPGSSDLFRSFRGTVAIDGREIPRRDFLGILAGTVEHVGLGFRPLSPLDAEKGTFHIIATGVTPMVFARNIVGLARGKHLQHPDHFDRYAKSAVISGDAPFVYTMDGDLYTAERDLIVETGPVVEIVSV
jgi:diacylglycerol kinase family enzyme